MKIHISEPNGPYNCVIDSKVMDVKLYEVFKGVVIETKDGQKLAVSMRDDGFEVHYYGGTRDNGFDFGWTEFKGGFIEPIKGKQ